MLPGTGVASVLLRLLLAVSTAAASPTTLHVRQAVSYSLTQVVDDICNAQQQPTSLSACRDALQPKIIASSAAYCHIKSAALTACEAAHGATTTASPAGQDACSNERADAEICSSYTYQTYEHCLSFGYKTVSAVVSCANIELQLPAASPTAIALPGGMGFPSTAQSSSSFSPLPTTLLFGGGVPTLISTTKTTTTTSNEGRVGSLAPSSPPGTPLPSPSPLGSSTSPLRSGTTGASSAGTTPADSSVSPVVYSAASGSSPAPTPTLIDAPEPTSMSMSTMNRAPFPTSPPLSPSPSGMASAVFTSLPGVPRGPFPVNVTTTMRTYTLGLGGRNGTASSLAPQAPAEPGDGMGRSTGGGNSASPVATSLSTSMAGGKSASSVLMSVSTGARSAARPPASTPAGGAVQPSTGPAGGSSGSSAGSGSGHGRSGGRVGAGRRGVWHRPKNFGGRSGGKGEVCVVKTKVVRIT